MAFALFSYQDENSTRHYRFEKSLKLSGPDGLLAEYIKKLELEESNQIKWQLSGEEIAKLSGVDTTAGNYEVVLDLYPEGLTQMSLHRVNRILGVSQDDWTDSVLSGQAIWNGGTPSVSAESKKNFSIQLPITAREMLEAFGIRGGYEKGTYRWTQPKMNIGAAVCRNTTSAVA